MNLHEYQSKRMFLKFGLPVPNGVLCKNIFDVEEYISKIVFTNDSQLVMKCQVHAGGRGKSGGVKLVKSIDEARIFAHRWFGNRIVTNQTNHLGQLVNKILIEEYIKDVLKETYLSITIDYSLNKIILIFCLEGGVDIEHINMFAPHLIHRIVIDPLFGVQPYQIKELIFSLKLDLNIHQIDYLVKFFINLIDLFKKYDLTLIEVNPLVFTISKQIICVDVKIIVDDNSLSRQSDLLLMYDKTQEDEREYYARKCGLNYISLYGNIGCMVNGAGLAMATMDIIRSYGGMPANFLDVGGSVTKDRVIEALKIILSDDNVRVILINIFGGIVRCDLIAEGIIGAACSVNINIPIVVRLEGNSSQLGLEHLINSNCNIKAVNNLNDAVQQAISFVKKDL